MHDETIPAPLLHRDLLADPEPASSSGVILKAVAIGLIALCVIAPLLR